MIESLDLLPSVKDLTVPVLVAACLWALKKLISPCVQFLANWIFRLRINELKRAKVMRSDPSTIQRQLAKEGALFNAFLLSATLSTGMMLIILPTAQSTELKTMLFAIYMAPVMVIEVWWLWHKQFIDVLIEEAARLGPSYKRAIAPRTQSSVRTKRRQARQASILDKAALTARRVARRVN